MLRLLLLLAFAITLVNFNLIVQASDSAAATLSGSGDIWIAIIVALLMKPVLARLFER